MWFFLGLLVGASVRLEPSTGPCSLAELTAVAPPPVWLIIAYVAVVSPLLCLAAVGYFRHQFSGYYAQVAQEQRMMRLARAEFEPKP